MNMIRKCLKTGLALLIFSLGSFIPCRAADGLPAEQSEMVQKAFTEKLDLQISKRKLSSKECEKLGYVKKKEENTSYEYDGYVYSLEFRNRSEMDLRDLAVECRFYYVMKESWQTIQQDNKTQKKDEKTVQKQLNHSFKIPSLPSKAEYNTETSPFVLESHKLSSAYYYADKDPEVVESRLQGLWVRVFRTSADGSKTHVDFCEPSELSSKVKW